MRDTFNNGDWSSAKFNSFIKSSLRRGSRGWPPIYQALNKALVGKLINTKTGRLANHYKCSSCQDLFPAKEVNVDHINPVITPSIGFSSWDEFINNLFCEEDNLQVMCKPCHNKKSLAEKQIVKERKANAK